MNRVVIGLHGLIGCGKTTTGEYLIEHLEKHKLKVVVLPFAGPLKQMARDLGWDGEKDEKGRKFLQILGTEIGRAYDEERWTNLWKKAASTAFIQGADVVIADDVRFDNEVVALNEVLDVQGFLVKIERPIKKEPWWKTIFKRSPKSHTSESGVTWDADFTIENNGSLGQLHSSIETLYNQVADELS